MTATLIACAHGTRSEQGRASIDALRARIAALVPDVPVAEAYVDVHGPELDDVASAPRAQGAVIVPLLLSTGFHTEVDIRRAALAGTNVSVARALGPHPLLADVLADRALAAGADPTWPLVIAAAGSSDARARDDVDAIRALVEERWEGPVTVGFVAAMAPTVSEAVASAAAHGGPVAVATYLLAPGHFADLVAGTGGAVTSAPLGDDPRIARVAVQRYAEALGSPASEPSVPGASASRASDPSSTSA
ncbi:sirohydrochlorin chelatase [Microbacterium invictum]|uniref:Sirohydrochlorin ferrochelatase n=1 Tax=Microbacterium invictum TaxID=515415 RepID=A0AA40VLL6_9MICO|nr:MULTISPECIES: CbiX/SirB N-terminal domain-containing protein [Microbacterium]MBB4138947.1 sirohydrochlorin ferrochelatase [Microbacterium invictum]